MISLLVAPPLVSPARSPVAFRLSSNNQYQSTGSAATCELQFYAYPNTPTAGNNITIAWGANTVIFSFVAGAPDDSGLQLREMQQAQTLPAFLFQTKTAMERNYLISRDFTLQVVNDSIILTARANGSTYDTTTTSNISQGNITITDTPGADDVLRDNFSILMQTLVDGTLVFTDAIPVANAIAIADLSELLQPSLTSLFQFPESGAVIQQHDSICRPYSIRYAEQYGLPLAQRALTTSATYYAFNGGIPYWKLKEYSDNSTSWWDRLQYNMMPLSWQPNTKTIRHTQVEKLYWLCWKPNYNGTQVRIRIACHHFNGSGVMTTTNIYSAYWSAFSYKVYECKVGYAFLNGLHNLDQYFKAYGSEPAGQYYEITILNAGGAILSDKRRYYVDFTAYPTERQFLFLNSLGGYDTLRCIGDAETDHAYEVTAIQQPMPTTFMPDHRDRKAMSIVQTTRHKANTGWMTLEQVNWLQDLMLSREVYEIIDDKIFPVFITTNTGPKYASEQSPAYFLEFEYERANTESHFATTSINTPGSPDFDPADFDSNDFNTN